MRSDLQPRLVQSGVASELFASATIFLLAVAAILLAMGPAHADQTLTRIAVASHSLAHCDGMSGSEGHNTEGYVHSSCCPGAGCTPVLFAEAPATLRAPVQAHSVPHIVNDAPVGSLLSQFRPPKSPARG